jgi:hypothetical protein
MLLGGGRVGEGEAFGAAGRGDDAVVFHSEGVLQRQAAHTAGKGEASGSGGFYSQSQLVQAGVDDADGGGGGLLSDAVLAPFARHHESDTCLLYESSHHQQGAAARFVVCKFKRIY